VTVPALLHPKVAHAQSLTPKPLSPEKVAVALKHAHNVVVAQLLGLQAKFAGFFLFAGFFGRKTAAERSSGDSNSKQHWCVTKRHWQVISAHGLSSCNQLMLCNNLLTGAASSAAYPLCNCLSSVHGCQLG
jgi:hypothetical protein